MSMLRVGLAAIAALLVAPLQFVDAPRASAATSSLVTCDFHLENARWHGACGRIFDEDPVMVLMPASAVSSGAWRKGVLPVAVWTGVMTFGKNYTTPLELETYPGATGVLRSEFGWFPISRFSLTPSALKFQLDTSDEVPPSGLDREIVQRADTLLSSDAVWNRSDNRRCPEGAHAWSIYCAMIQATKDITGVSDHRRPAMEIVRIAVEKRTEGRNYHHRLMDYNNDPTTRLSDVHSLFAEVLANTTWVQ
jgi:hypothetical protein